MLSKIISCKHLAISLILILFIIVSIFVNSVPLYSDGAYHARIIKEISVTSNLPDYDITGIQLSNLNVPISISDKPLFLFPGFYILGAILNFFLNNELWVLFLLNLMPIVLSIYFFFRFFRNYFNPLVSFFSIIILFFSNFFLWLISHRLIEPAIIMFAALLFWLSSEFIKNSHKNKKVILWLITIFLVALFFIKQTGLFIIIIIFLILFSMEIKKGFIKVVKDYYLYLFIFFILIIPCIMFFVFIDGNIFTSKLNISFIDSLFPNAWWEKDILPWEDNLNFISNKDLLRAKTFEQFRSIQMGAEFFINNQEFAQLAQRFSIYPIFENPRDGFSSPITNKIWYFFLLLFVFGLIGLMKNRTVLLLILVFSTTIVFLAWSVWSVFRYYLWFPFIFSFIFALGLYLILKNLRKNKMTKILLILSLIFFLFFGMSAEINRDINYAYTIGHRAVPNNAGGVYELIDAAKEYSNHIPVGTKIFTNVPEVTYYFNAETIWDDRLFFVPYDKVSYFFSKYNSYYLIIPYYSGTIKSTDWKYYNGIPSDSNFNLHLINQDCFKLIKKYVSFNLYKFTCQDINK